MSRVLSGIYLAPAACGQGLGNEASVRLHRAFGFEQAGLYREIGRKFGRFWDGAAFLKPFGADGAAGGT